MTFGQAVTLIESKMMSDIQREMGGYGNVECEITIDAKLGITTYGIVVKMKGPVLHE